MNDDGVRRINQITTTFLDTLAVLLLAAGACWTLWVMVSPGLGLAAAGALIGLFSLLAQRQATVKRVPPAAADAVPPGPADPGNLHVMGR